MKMICNKRHFGAGGKLVEVGATNDGKPDGVFWVPAKGNATMEVATPGKPSAADVVKQIKESEDMEFLEQMLEDSRKTVSDAAADRIEKLTDTEDDDGAGEGDGGQDGEDSDNQEG